MYRLHPSRDSLAVELAKSCSAFSFLRSKWWPIIVFTLGFAGSVIAIMAYRPVAMVLPYPSSSSSSSASIDFYTGPTFGGLTGRIWSLLSPGSLWSHTHPHYACTLQGAQLASLPSLPSHNSSTDPQFHCVRDHGNFSHAGTGKSSDTSLLGGTEHASGFSSSTPSRMKIDATCDIYTGDWVEDNTYPLYKPDSCPFVDKKFNCQLNGRNDTKYTKWRWAPTDCMLPRFSGRQMLETLRGKRLVFVGDSLNRNQWESMLCLLREALVNKSRIERKPGSNRILKFLDYNCTVEFYKSRYLVDMIEGSNETDYTIRLDRMDKSEAKWRRANIMVFNTAHWWGPGKLGKGENRFQEGDKVHAKLDVMVAYKRALITWAKWVDRHVDADETHVFFRTYSPQHFRGGKWNSGGHCEDETEPAYEESNLPTYPNEMRALKEVLGSMKVQVHMLNVTKLSAYRKDAHPSVYWHPRQFKILQQDCGHWCLPGVPDSWNELLYHALMTFSEVKPYV